MELRNDGMDVTMKKLLIAFLVMLMPLMVLAPVYQSSPFVGTSVQPQVDAAGVRTSIGAASSVDLFNATNNPALFNSTNVNALWHTTNGVAFITDLTNATNNPALFNSTNVNALWHTTNGVAYITDVTAASNNVFVNSKVFTNTLGLISIFTNQNGWLGSNVFNSSVANYVTNISGSVGSNLTAGFATTNDVKNSTNTVNLIANLTNQNKWLGTNVLTDAALADLLGGGSTPGAASTNDVINATNTLAGTIPQTVTNIHNALGGGISNTVAKGTAYLVAGEKTVSCTNVLSDSIILMSSKGSSALSLVGESFADRVVGVSFKIVSTFAGDTNAVDWVVMDNVIANTYVINTNYSANLIITQLTFVTGTNNVILSGTNAPEASINSAGVDWYANRFIGPTNVSGDFIGSGAGLVNVPASSLIGTLPIPDRFYWTADAGNVSWMNGWVDQPASYVNTKVYLSQTTIQNFRNQRMIHFPSAGSNNWFGVDWMAPNNYMRTNIAVTWYLLSRDATTFPLRTALTATSMNGTNQIVDSFADTMVTFPAGTNVMTHSDNYVIPTNSTIWISVWCGDITNRFTNSPEVYVIQGNMIQW